MAKLENRLSACFHSRSQRWRMEEYYLMRLQTKKKGKWIGMLDREKERRVWLRITKQPCLVLYVQTIRLRCCTKKSCLVGRAAPGVNLHWILPFCIFIKVAKADGASWISLDGAGTSRSDVDGLGINLGTIAAGPIGRESRIYSPITKASLKASSAAIARLLLSWPTKRRYRGPTIHSR